MEYSLPSPRKRGRKGFNVARADGLTEERTCKKCGRIFMSVNPRLRCALCREASRAARASRDTELTRREGQMAALVLEGLTNDEIGARLGLTGGTVKVVLSRAVFKKLGARGKMDMLARENARLRAEVARLGGGES